MGIRRHQRRNEAKISAPSGSFGDILKTRWACCYSRSNRILYLRALGRNVLLVFEPKEREDVYKIICTKVNLKEVSSFDFLIDYERMSSLHFSWSLSEQNQIAEGSRQSRIWRTKGTQLITTKWQNREITNFQYLMYLNTLGIHVFPSFCYPRSSFSLRTKQQPGDPTMIWPNTLFSRGFYLIMSQRLWTWVRL